MVSNTISQAAISLGPEKIRGRPIIANLIQELIKNHKTNIFKSIHSLFDQIDAGVDDVAESGASQRGASVPASDNDENIG